MIGGFTEGRQMFGWIFGKKEQAPREHVEPFRHGETLTLEWDHDSEGWTCPLPTQGSDARLYLGAAQPSPEACGLILEIRERIPALNDAALLYLLHHEEAVDFVRAAHKHAVTRDSFLLTGAELYEHYDEGSYSLTYEATFNRGAIWMVHFKHHAPEGWGFDG